MSNTSRTFLAHVTGKSVVDKPLRLFAQAWKAGTADARFTVSTTFKGPFEVPAYGKALVIAHGLMGTSNNFHSAGTQLSKSLGDVLDGVAAVDMRNHGRSPHSDLHSSTAMALDLIKYVGDLADAAPVSDEEPSYVLMGHSMGGTAVIMAMLMLNDTDMQKVVLHQIGDAEARDRLEKAFHDVQRSVKASVVVDVCPYMRMPRAFCKITHDLQALADLPMTSQLTPKMAGEQLRAKIPNDMMRNFLLTNLVSGRPRDDVVSSWRCNLPVLQASMDKLVFPFTETADVKVKQPTKFIFGETSEYNFPDGRAAIPRFFAKYDVTEIAGCGHYPHYEKRDDFCAVAEPFIRAAFE
jgi:esterase